MSTRGTRKREEGRGGDVDPMIHLTTIIKSMLTKMVLNKWWWCCTAHFSCPYGISHESDIELKTNMVMERTMMRTSMTSLTVASLWRGDGADRSDGDGHMVRTNDGRHKLPRFLHGTFFTFLLFFTLFFPSSFLFPPFWFLFCCCFQLSRRVFPFPCFWQTGSPPCY